MGDRALRYLFSHKHSIFYLPIFSYICFKLKRKGNLCVISILKPI